MSPRNLIASGRVHGVLPISACGPEIAAGRLRYAPLCQPTITHHLGVAATTQLDLPREFAFKIGDVLREEVARLTESGEWPARFLAQQRWDPNIA